MAVDTGWTPIAYRDVSEVLTRVGHVVEFINAEVTEVNQTGIFGNTPLSIVVGWGDILAANLLLDAGADIEQKVERGDTPLHTAIRNKSIDVVKLLLERGASTFVKNDDAQTALELAQNIADLRILNAVREKGVANSPE